MEDGQTRCSLLNWYKDRRVFLPSGDGTVDLKAWSDADWARDYSNRRSRSGYFLTISGGPIVWSSKLQSATTLSACETELYALSYCMHEVNWVLLVLKELWAEQMDPTIIFQDSLGTIKWKEEIQGLRGVKHIEILYHYVKDPIIN